MACASSSGTKGVKKTKGITTNRDATTGRERNEGQNSSRGTAVHSFLYIEVLFHILPQPCHISSRPRRVLSHLEQTKEAEMGSVLCTYTHSAHALSVQSRTGMAFALNGAATGSLERLPFFHVMRPFCKKIFGPVRVLLLHECYRPVAAGELAIAALLPLAHSCFLLRFSPGRTRPLTPRPWKRTLRSARSPRWRMTHGGRAISLSLPALAWPRPLLPHPVRHARQHVFSSAALLPCSLLCAHITFCVAHPPARRQSQSAAASARRGASRRTSQSARRASKSKASPAGTPRVNRSERLCCTLDQGPTKGDPSW